MLKTLTIGLVHLNEPEKEKVNLKLGQLAPNALTKNTLLRTAEEGGALRREFFALQQKIEG